MGLKQLVLLPVLFALCFSQVSAQEAKPDTVRSDMRCLAVAVTVTGATTGAMQTAGLINAFYWMGRVDEQVPPSEVEGRMVLELAEISKPGVFQSEAARCGEELKARGAAFTEIGKDIQERAKEIQPKPDTK